MAARIFLGIVGAVYLSLAAWCSLKPVETSQLVGFELKRGSGQSEFLVIYGGLELALALLFLLPIASTKHTQTSLLACLIVHACLVLFRSISFFLYSDISTMTQKLAVSEWLIFLIAAVFYWRESAR